MINVFVRKLFSFAAVIALSIGLVITSHAQTVLLDFGSNTSYRGLSIVNPDANGNSWNSLQPGAFYENAVDINNVPTTIDVGFDTPIGTDSYNGPAGPTGPEWAGAPTPQLLIDVTFSDVDAEALGILGGGCDVATGTGTCEGVFDFAATDPGAVAQFQIQGLDPTKSYNLTFFASHKYSTDNTTIYKVYTDNTYTTVVASTTLEVMDPSNPVAHNRDKVATITGLSPQADNILYIEFAAASGGEGGIGYLNDMLLEGVASSLAGDFDGDGDVDGRDFLRWQRGGSPAPLSSGDLTAWRTNYGMGGLAAVSAVPEPSTVCLMFFASISAVGFKRSSRPMA